MALSERTRPYIIAVAGVAMASVLRVGLDPWLGVRAVFLFYIVAIALTASVAGMRAGLLATGLSVAAVAYWHLEPYRSLAVATSADRVQLGLFVLAAAGLCWLCGALHHTRMQLERDQAQLRRDNERFKFAAAAVKGIIYDYDLESGRVERTRGLWEVAGYRTDDVPPTAAWWEEQIHPDDRDASRRAFTAAVIANDSVESTYRFRHADGRWRYAEDRAVIVRHGDTPRCRCL